MGTHAVWLLGAARRGEDRFVSRTDLPTITLADLRTLFPPPADDPLMYNSYEVTAKQREFLEALTGQVLDMERFDYSVECEAYE
jgi:hypothetical protein